MGRGNWFMEFSKLANSVWYAAKTPPPLKISNRNRRQSRNRTFENILNFHYNIIDLEVS